MCAQLLALAAVALGCSHTEHIGKRRTLQIALTEYRLNPQDVAARRGRLTILVRNYGRLTHNLVISRRGVSAGSTPPLGPGASARLTLVLAPGSYRMASTILSDQALGQYGTLTVGS